MFFWVFGLVLLCGFCFEVMSLYLIKDKELKSKTAHACTRRLYIRSIYNPKGRKKKRKKFDLSNFLFGTLNFLDL